MSMTLTKSTSAWLQRQPLAKTDDRPLRNTVPSSAE